MVTPANKKDGKYWERRVKNNVAAQRSRQARRLKENQIALRAAFLERENKVLKKVRKNLVSSVFMFDPAGAGRLKF